MQFRWPLSHPGGRSSIVSSFDRYAQFRVYAVTIAIGLSVPIPVPIAAPIATMVMVVSMMSVVAENGVFSSCGPAICVRQLI